MAVILFVAGETILWRAFKDRVDMTFFAGNCQMGIGQFEGSQIMVEVNRLPIIGCMTSSTV